MWKGGVLQHMCLCDGFLRYLTRGIYVFERRVVVTHEER